MKPHRGTLILGVLGLLLCAPLGIVAWAQASRDLRRMDAGEMDPSGRKSAKIGKVLGIIGAVAFAVEVLAGMSMLVVVAPSRGCRGDKKTSTVADIDAFNTALVMYQSKSLSYPTTEQGLKALVVRPTAAPVPVHWAKTMGRVMPDPWGHDFYYYYPGKRNGIAKPDVGSCGPDGIEGNEDDLGNWAHPGLGF